MRSLLAVFAILILVLAGYLYIQPVPPAATSEVSEASEVSEVSEEREVKPENADNADEQNLREEARQYVDEIIEHRDDPVEVESADDFISRDEPISLFANRQYQTSTINELHQEIMPDAPLTIVREQEQVELTSTKELLAESGGNLGATIKVLQGGDVKKSTVGEILQDHRDPDAPISIIKRTEHLEVTTLRELMNNDSLAANEPLKVIREPYRLQSTTVGELLMGADAVSEDSIFYVRNVTESDSQGLWGIVHNGLVKNFASGIALRRGQEIRQYQVDIPPAADERLADQSSSFLGKMIDRKTRESFVYNYDKGRMGQHPDVIHPGQEIVIIGFTPEELYQIYEHFVTRSEAPS